MNLSPHDMLHVIVLLATVLGSLAAPTYCPVNAAGLAVIKAYQPLVKAPSASPLDLQTVGYGHVCRSQNCGEVKYAFPLTEETATSLLNEDLKAYTACLGGRLSPSKARLGENQWAAVVSLLYSLGIEDCDRLAERTSGILARLNAGDEAGVVISQEFPKYTKAGGHTLVGLVRRRAAEVTLSKVHSTKLAYPQCT